MIILLIKVKKLFFKIEKRVKLKLLFSIVETIDYFTNYKDFIG